jgi:hypothetical protein
VRETSDYLNKQLPKGNKLVILNIQSDFPALSEYIIDELIANTVNDKVFSVVDRRQLDTIRAELDFQMSGEVDDETAQSVGKMAGAQIIVSGAVSRIGDLYRLRVRALSVQSAEIEGQFNRNIPDGATITALVRSQATGYGADGATGGAVTGGNYGGSGGGTAATASAQAGSAKSSAAPAPVQAVPAQTAAPARAPAPAPAAQKVYKIGDTGPAGGIIFYDKGNSVGGWQYLEAAPPEMESIAGWAPYTIAWDDRRDGRVDGTNPGVGQGKQSTQAIVTFMRKNNVSNTAAQTCQQLLQGGYTDWFLPSQSELNLMYFNLKKNELGGFGEGSYWSSSQASSQDTYAWYQNFSDGTQKASYKHNELRVRPIRQF